MEVIRKEISIDKSRSHKSGLLPFVQYETGVYVHSGVTSANTNYGHYVCDLAIKLSGETKGIKTYEELSAITLSTLTIGDKYKISNSHGSINEFTYTPENTIYMWDGNRWVFYEKTIKYLDIINQYYDIKDIIKKSYFCKRTTNKNGETVLKICPNENITGDFSACTMSCETNIYNYKVLAKNKFYTDNNIIFQPQEDILDIINNGLYFILIDDYDSYLNIEKWGGDLGLSAETISNGFTVKKYIEDNILDSSGASNTFFLVSPTVDIPVLLEQECTYDGLYIPYEYMLDGPDIEEVNVGGIVYSAKVGTNIILYSDYIIQNSSPNEIEGNKIEYGVGLPIMCESRLEKVKHYSANEIVEGYFGVSEGWTKTETTSALTNENIVQVLTEEFNAGQMFECKFYTSSVTFEGGNKIYPNLVNTSVYQVIVTEENDETISWWECMCVNDALSSYTCHEGLMLPEDEDEEADKKYYQNVVTLSCIPYYNIGLVDTNKTYYFKAFYQNGKVNPNDGGSIMDYTTIKKVSFPFVVGEPVNIETYPTGEIVYDMVLSANTYEEVGKYRCAIEYVLGATSGYSGTGIFYNEILDYVSGVTKNVFIDNVFESDLWYEKLDYDSNLREHYNEIYDTNFLVREAQITKFETNNIEYIDYPLITRDGMESLYNNPIISTDIIFNRGAAAACEKHFKLSECNTFQDLKKYGNNIFNL